MRPRIAPAAFLLAATALQAWSPRFHEVQTRLAMEMVPRPMARFLRANAPAVLAGARGVASDRIPTPEEVEDTFMRVLQLSEERRGPQALARELGVLAHRLQLLTDPSATTGITPLRVAFEAYADENLGRMVLVSEPFWALRCPLDPRPHLLDLNGRKWERHRILLDCLDPETGRPKGVWDTLSLPFAQLQLSFSGGVHATANVWILLYRAAGDLWPLTGDDDIKLPKD